MLVVVLAMSGPNSFFSKLQQNLFRSKISHDVLLHCCLLVDLASRLATLLLLFLLLLCFTSSLKEGVNVNYIL